MDLRLDDGGGLADAIDRAVRPLSSAVNDVVFFAVEIAGVRLPLVVVWLIGAAAILTVALRFVNLRGFTHGWALIGRQVRDDSDQTDAPGEISHFEALTSALSGTVGLGNIASVPVAIVLGGPGAVFWMILAGFLGMSSKFAECALAVKYRRVNADGTVSGGPMYYIEAVFERLGSRLAGRIGAIFFAVMCMGASISVFQVNQAHAQFVSVTSISAPLVFGAIMAGGVAIVILGGIRQIARVTRVLVPLMAAIYLLAGLTILILNAGAVPDAVAAIIKGAFGFEAAGGGVVGAMINGIQRATYSSEAGVGSAAIAHASVRTREPMTEGYVALLEPFIDTVVVCTLTALVIIVSGAYLPFVGAERVVGIEITSFAFASAFSWYPYVLLVSVTLFAFSTLVTWSHYGAKAAEYLFGRSLLVDRTFKIVLCLMLSTGAAIQLSSIIDFIDSMLFAMAVPNIVALYFLLPELRRDVADYDARLRDRQSASGA
ncbi:MAG: alanine/glycine:cation symporter family protein [Pseudomonadota bacterium]